MSEEVLPTYMLWFPRLAPDGAIVLNATGVEQSAPPIGSPVFMAGLVATLRLAGEPVALDVRACRSSYFGEEDPDSWEDAFPLSFRLALGMAPPPDAPPRLRHEMIGTLAFDPAAMDRPPPATVDALVIADFVTEDAADRCRAALRADARTTALRERGGHPPPSFERVAVGPLIVQEQIDLGPFTDRAFRRPPAYLRAVEALCRAHGGLTRHEERVAERDEAYDADGLA
jgi:hypothetical protein